MKQNEQQTFEYWDREFESRGFESDVTDGSAHETWYRNGDFHIGYDAEDFRDKTCPKFDIVYHERGEGLHGNEQDVRVSGRVRIAGFVMPFEYRITSFKVSELLFVLDALAEPKKLPMCIGIRWVEELVSIFLQQPAAGKI